MYHKLFYVSGDFLGQSWRCTSQPSSSSSSRTRPTTSSLSSLRPLSLSIWPWCWYDQHYNYYYYYHYYYYYYHYYYKLTNINVSWVTVISQRFWRQCSSRSQKTFQKLPTSRWLTSGSSSTLWSPSLRFQLRHNKWVFKNNVGRKKPFHLLIFAILFQVLLHTFIDSLRIDESREINHHGQTRKVFHQQTNKPARFFINKQTNTFELWPT